MTTAHRPTWYPAIGGENQGGNKQYMPTTARSSKDIAGFTQMKFRQDATAEDEENMRAELEAKERKHLQSKRPRDSAGAIEDDTEERAAKRIKLEESGEEKDETSEVLNARAKVSKKASNPDADDSDDSEDESEDEKESNNSDSDDSDDDDDDDEAELLRELERIRKEREEEKERQAAERERSEQDTINREVMAANPLLGGAPASFNIKKKWYEDTVFKNQAKREVKHKKRFINDTLRNDFHRKFLDKYIK